MSDRKAIQIEIRFLGRFQRGFHFLEDGRKHTYRAKSLGHNVRGLVIPHWSKSNQLLESVVVV
jgi:hypothetical protein